MWATRVGTWGSAPSPGPPRCWLSASTSTRAWESATFRSDFAIARCRSCWTRWTPSPPTWRRSSEAREAPAVADDGLAGDVARGVAGEEDDHRADVVLGITDSSQR